MKRTEQDMTSGRTESPAPPSDAGEVTGRSRWLARLGLLIAALAAVLPLAAAGLRGGLGLVLLGVAGLAAAAAGAWWFLTHRGVVRVLAGALVVAAPVVLVVVFVRAGLLWVVVVDAGLWAAFAGVSRAAFAELATEHAPAEYSTPPPRRPFLIMNPRSGGGKVAKFDLVTRARDLGVEVVLLDAPGIDVTDLAQAAVARGADLLGVAGGDGTQALVAAVAAEHDVPFLVLSAGTRNHFALDLGLDRENPAAGLDALTDGVEIRVDLGSIGGRTFVNNASFGAYAAVVQSPAYRDDKIRTALDMLPDLLVRQRGSVLLVRAGSLQVSGPAAVLVSNNPYGSEDLAGLGRRYRLDRGQLGVLAVTVERTADAAELAVGLARGRRARAVLSTTCPEVTIDSDAAELPVGVDGEALLMPTPVQCSIRPGALRVRVPRNRPGVAAPRPRPAWTDLTRLALPSSRTRAS
jgi:diacylglycerol kinase family enzyme